MSEGERERESSALRVPGGLSTMLAIAAVAWKRLLRGRALWVGVVLALMPLTYAIGMRAAEVERGLRPNLFIFEQLVLSILAPMFVASSIGEEIEDRTITYLWSRPVPRWAVLAGKLAALSPIPGLLISVSWLVGLKIGMSLEPAARSYVALFAGGLAVSMISAGLAVLVPRHGMALTVVYMLFDAAMSNIPASIQSLTISYNVRAVAQVPSINEGDASSGALWLAVIGLVWLGIGLWRIRRLEA
jgi:hypothetical protein